MFGDLLGNVQQQQEALKQRLSEIVVAEETDNSAIRIKASAAREILDIEIDSTRIDVQDIEQLQDLLLTVINRVLEKAAAEEKNEAQKMITNMLPPGLSGLFGR